MNDFIQKLEKNIATVNLFDAICQKISDYNISTGIHQILKIHAGQCMYKHINYKNVDDDAFNNIITAINELCSDYKITYDTLCNIFNMLGVYSIYDERGTIDYILECLFDEEVNYELVHEKEFKLFLEFYKDTYNASYDEMIGILTYYFYHTDLRDSFIQAYGVRLAEKMHKDHKYYNIRYINYMVQHLSNMLQLNIVHLDGLYHYIFDNEYDLFPNVVTYDHFKEYEYEYCTNNHINYSDYVIDHNQLIRFKK